jgi:hypothetical protein
MKEMFPPPQKKKQANRDVCGDGVIMKPSTIIIIIAFVAFVICKTADCAWFPLL